MYESETRGKCMFEGFQLSAYKGLQEYTCVSVQRASMFCQDTAPVFVTLDNCHASKL